MKKQIWKFSLTGHGLFSLYPCLISWPSGSVSQLENQQLVLYQGAAQSDSLPSPYLQGPACARPSGCYLLSPPAGCHMSSLDSVPPGAALHSSAAISWGRFMQVGNKLTTTDAAFQCWALLYS